MEGFRGGGEAFYRPEAREKDPLLELQENIDKLDLLLAKLIERSGELTSYQKQLLRNAIQTLMQQIGITDLSQLADLKAGLLAKVKEPPEIDNYPTLEEFEEALVRVMVEERPSWLPEVYRDPNATDVSRFGQADWRRIQDRTGKGTLIDDLYNTGRIMSSEFHYRNIFEEGDEIEIGNGWNITNGRHRAFALRALGERYVQGSGMDNWVTVKHEV